jgi:hypothetical protein
MKADKTSMKNYSLNMMAVGAISFMATASAQAQDITKYQSGISSSIGVTTGFVCEGDIQDKGDNRINCTGPIYRADEYAAKYARQNSDQLDKLIKALDQLNTSLDKLNKTSEATQDVLSKQVEAFNNDLRAYIEKRLQGLPKDALQSEALQKLRKSLMDYVDQRLKASGDTPAPGTAAP